jgi:hypothetical protein
MSRSLTFAALFLTSTTTALAGAGAARVGVPMGSGPALGSGPIGGVVAGSTTFDGRDINDALAGHLAASAGENLLSWDACTESKFEGGLEISVGDCIQLNLGDAYDAFTSVVLSSATCSTGEGCVAGYQVTYLLEVAATGTAVGFEVEMANYLGGAERGPGVGFGSRTLSYVGRSVHEQFSSSAGIGWWTTWFDRDEVELYSDGQIAYPSGDDDGTEPSCRDSYLVCLDEAEESGDDLLSSFDDVSEVYGVGMAALALPEVAGAGGAVSLVLVQKAASKAANNALYTIYMVAMVASWEECVNAYNSCKASEEATGVGGDAPEDDSIGE